MAKLLVETSLILGLVVVILLLFYGKRSRNNSNLLLAASISCICYLLFVNHLNETGEMLNWLYFARTGYIAGFLVIPFLYLYTRNTFYPGIQWRQRDWLFLVPAIFYIIDLIPFFLSDNAYKIAVMKANRADHFRMIRVEEGWLPIKGFHYIFMYLWSVAIMIFQVRLILRNKHTLSESPDSMNRSLFWFIITLTAFHVPLIIPGIFGVLFHMKWYTLQYLSSVLSLHLITSAVFILFSPKVLYGFFPQLVIESDLKTKKLPVKAPPIEHSSHPKFYLSGEDMERLVEKIERFMDDEKPYLNQQYTIHQLGADIKIPVYQLSPIINQHYKSNFNTWVNQYRVKYFLELCKNQKRKELTLEALSEESGFNNRSTFINSFKKEMGTTPGQYLKQL